MNEQYKKASEEFINFFLKDSKSRFDFNLGLFVNDLGIDKEANSKWMIFFNGWMKSRNETLIECALLHMNKQ